MKRVLAATLVSVPLMAGLGWARPVSAAPAVDGKKVYAENCARCHGADGQGSTGKVPPLAGSEFMHEPVAKRVRIMLHGLTGTVSVKERPYRSTMTPKDYLSDAQLAAVLNYVARAWGNKGDLVTEAQVKGYRHVRDEGETAENWRGHPPMFETPRRRR